MDNTVRDAYNSLSEGQKKELHIAIGSALRMSEEGLTEDQETVALHMLSDALAQPARRHGKAPSARRSTRAVLGFAGEPPA